MQHDRPGNLRQIQQADRRGFDHQSRRFSRRGSGRIRQDAEYHLWELPGCALPRHRLRRREQSGRGHHRCAGDDRAFRRFLFPGCRHGRLRRGADPLHGQDDQHSDRLHPRLWRDDGHHPRRRRALLGRAGRVCVPDRRASGKNDQRHIRGRRPRDGARHEIHRADGERAGRLVRQGGLYRAVAADAPAGDRSASH